MVGGISDGRCAVGLRGGRADAVFAALDGLVLAAVTSRAGGGPAAFRLAAVAAYQHKIIIGLACKHAIRNPDFALLPGS